MSSKLSCITSPVSVVSRERPSRSPNHAYESACCMRAWQNKKIERTSGSTQRSLAGPNFYHPQESCIAEWPIGTFAPWQSQQLVRRYNRPPDWRELTDWQLASIMRVMRLGTTVNLTPLSHFAIHITLEFGIVAVHYPPSQSSWMRHEREMTLRNTARGSGATSHRICLATSLVMLQFPSNVARLAFLLIEHLFRLAASTCSVTSAELWVFIRETHAVGFDLSGHY